MILETAQTVRQKRASEVFLDLLGQLFAGGQEVLDDDMRNPRDPAPGTTKAGYRDEEYLPAAGNYAQGNQQGSAAALFNGGDWRAAQGGW